MKHLAPPAVPSVLLAWLLLAIPVGGQAQTLFTTTLTGAQEVPPVATSGTGAGFFTLTPAGLTFSLRGEGLSAPIIGAHFHVAPPGVDGPIVRTIAFAGGTAAGIWQATDPEPLTAAHVAALLAGEVYVNVHTTAHENGEVRGQLRVPSLAAAVLPSSRSVQENTAATAFATVINVGPAAATGCGITLHSPIPATLTFQTTNPSTNAVTGMPNAPVDIAAGGAQTFLIALTPTAPLAPTDVQFRFTCGTGSPAFAFVGLNTLTLTASADPVPDVVALAAAPGGTVTIPGVNATGAFAVATVNVGAPGSITASADTGAATLPVVIALCRTDPMTGACLAPPAPTVTVDIADGATPTFAIFVTGSATVAPDPAQHRVFVRFRDAGGVTRGATSVAVATGG